MPIPTAPERSYAMNKSPFFRRLMTVSLCAAMVLSMLPATVFASSGKEDDTPAATTTPPTTEPAAISSAPRYILQFVAGEDGYSATGTNMGSVTVNYTTTSGKTGSVTVDLYEGYKGLFPDTSIQSLSSSTYHVDDAWGSIGSLGTGVLDKGDEELNTIARDFIGNYYSSTTRGIDAFSSYTVALDAPSDVKTFDSIQVKLTANDSLSLQSLRIIKISSWDDEGTGSNKHLDNYYNGGYSSQLEGRWTGTLVAKAYGTCNGGTTTTFSTSNRKLTNYASGSQQTLTNTGEGVGISLHIADTPTAGVEALMAGYASNALTADAYKDKFDSEGFYKLGEQSFSAYANLSPFYEEFINLEITYLDTMNETRIVEIPLLTTYLLSILSTNRGNLCGNSFKSWISGIFQQNETVALSFRLAQYESLVGIQVTYGDSPDYLTTARKLSTVDTAKDTLTLDQICFYEGTTRKNFTTKYNTTYLSCILETSLTPVYSYTSSSSSGATLATDHVLNVTLSNNKLIEGAPVEKDLTDTYVFTLTNSTVDKAGTYSGIYMNISYMDTNGFEHTMENLSLKELVGQFYGYSCNHDSLLWKKQNGIEYGYYLGDAENDLYMQYWEHLRYSGSTTQFQISVSNLAYFTSITFTIKYEGTQQESVPNSSTSHIDSWQLDELTIQKATAIGQRYSVNGRSQRPSTWASTGFPLWTRDVTGENVAWTNQKMLLQSGVVSQTIYLTYIDTNGEIVKPDTTIAKNDYLYEMPTSMTYQEATKNLGLTVPKYTYQINVEVADVSDAGSTNYFYFQLIFENGTSAVVLANQQLSSDSFRQGCIETFQIQTTQNYGNLKSVRIICDSATSTSNVFDKLNISNVAVTLVGTTGVSRVWNVSNIGWIDINYADEGSVYYSGNSDVIIPAETANVQLVKEYAVTGITTAVDLLFCISTASDSSFSGSSSPAVNATLLYLDSTGTLKEMSFNLTDKIKAFNGTDEPDWLYRSNQVDRFTLSVPDISSVLSLELSRSDGGEDWIISSVTVQQVGGLGGVYMAASKEYVRDATTSIDLAKSDNTGNVTLTGSDSYVFNFGTNEIAISEADDDSWNASISREPTTTNDTLNIYLYSGQVTGKSYPFTDKTSLKGSVKYTTNFGTYMQNSFTFKLGTSGDQKIMYVEGITADNLATLNQLTLINQSSDSYSTVVDYAVVQQVRNGVIVNTYVVTYGARFISNHSGSPGNTAHNPMTQTVTLKSAGGQGSINLTAESYDIAVALRYTTKSSPDGQKTVYQSPYIYLTDQQIMTLASNQDVVLEFGVCDVDDIVGLTIVSTGPNFKFERAEILNYNADTGALEDRAAISYSFAATTIEGKFDCDSSGLTPVTFIFVTPDNSTIAGAGTFGQVQMAVTYVKTDGTTVTETFSDLISRLETGSSFNAGTTTSLTLLLDEAAEIKSITLYAPDDNWYLSSVGVSLTNTNGITDTKAVITESWVKALEPLTVNMSAANSVVLGINVTAYAQATAETFFSNGSNYLLTQVIPGDTLILTPEMIYSGEPDITWTWDLGTAKDVALVMVTDNTVRLMVPGNAQPGQVYMLTVSSNADPTLNVTVMVYVTKASTVNSNVSAEANAMGTGITVVGNGNDSATLNAYATDTVTIQPSYQNQTLTDSDWTWDLTNVKGTTYIDNTGRLLWTLNGECSPGDIVILSVTHNATGIQVAFAVKVISTDSVIDITVTGTTTGTAQTQEGTPGTALRIDAYPNDVLTLTPKSNGVSTGSWSWNYLDPSYITTTGSDGTLTVQFLNLVSAGDVYTLTVTHEESGAVVTVIVTIVEKEIDASSVTLEGALSNAGTTVSAKGGGTLKIETAQDETITLRPYLDGETLASGNWEWDLSEIQDFALEGSGGVLTLNLSGKAEAGKTYKTSLTHLGSGTVIYVEITVPGTSSSDESPFAGYAYSAARDAEAYSSKIVYLDVCLNDRIYAYLLQNHEFVYEEDVNWDMGDYSDYFTIKSGCAAYTKLEGNLPVGTVITITATHISTGYSVTFVFTVIENEG